MTEIGAPRPTLTTFELVTMVAALSALNAVSIDIMLPALPDIAQHFRLTNDNDRQLVVVTYVAMFGVVQLIYGPLSDAFGRRSVLVWALGIYIIATLLCVVAPTFEWLLVARGLQGVGAAAMRVVSTAVVRDLTEGRRMAQIMSMAMTVFMIIPITAPALGQGILFVAPWQWIFGVLLIYALLVLTWTFVRLPETLAPERRASFNVPAIIKSYRFVLSQRQSVGYMIACTFMSGALFAYIAAAEQVFVDVYALDEAFPLAFAAVALVITASTVMNARLVMRLGMRRISHAMTLWFTIIATLHAILLALGLITFWPFLILLSLTIGAFGMVAGNFNALAMEPVGAAAGSGAAVFGAATSAGGALLGGLIARQFDGTPLPFVIGLACAGLATMASLLWVERGRLFGGAPLAR